MLHVASACTPCCVLLEVVVQSLIPVKLLAPSKRTQHCWPTTPTMLDVTCCVFLHTLLSVVGSCRAKFDTGQTFSPVQTDATLLATMHVRTFKDSFLQPVLSISSNRHFHHFHISYNTPCLPPKPLHNLCYWFLLGITVFPREIKDNVYAKFYGANKVYYGRCANGQLKRTCYHLDQISRPLPSTSPCAHPSSRSGCHVPPPAIVSGAIVCFLFYFVLFF